MLDPRCPACPGSAPLTVLDVSWRTGVGMYRCDRCLGVLADARAVAVARDHYGDAHPLMVRRRGPQRCRSCHARTPPGATRCAPCGASLELACPLCGRKMSIVEVGGVAVDLCRACELTYFDRGEFAAVCRARGALQRALRQPQTSAGLAAGDVLGIAAHFSPSPGDVLFVGDVTQAVGEIAVRTASGVAEAAAVVDVTSVAAAAGGSALDATSAGSEVAAGAAEAVLELLAGLFSP